MTDDAISLKGAIEGARSGAEYGPIADPIGPARTFVAYRPLEVEWADGTPIDLGRIPARVVLRTVAEPTLSRKRRTEV